MRPLKNVIVDDLRGRFERKLESELETQVLRGVRSAFEAGRLSAYISGQLSDEPELFSAEPGFLIKQNVVERVESRESGSIVRIKPKDFREIYRALKEDPDFMRKYSRHSREFEELVAGAYDLSGADEVILTRFSRDGGKDIVATYTLPGKLDGTLRHEIWDQVKTTKQGRNVGVETFSQVLGLFNNERTNGHRIDRFYITTNNGFTQEAQERFAESVKRGTLFLRDGERTREWLLKLLEKHFHQSK